MNLHILLRLLRDRWLSIALVTILAAATAAVLDWRKTPQYAAKVTLFVSARDGGTDASAAYMGSLLSQQKVKSYAELVRSQPVLGGAAQSLGLRGGAGALDGRVGVALVPDTVLLELDVRDPDPAQAKRIADTVAARFVALVPTLEASDDPKKPAVTVRAVSPATSYGPVSPRPARDTALGALIGLLIGVGLAAARHSLDTSVKTADDAGELAGAPALGTLPRDAAGARTTLGAAGDAYSPWNEAVRKIKTSLRFVGVAKPHRVMLVTSPNAGEGKTTTACNLAVSLAESGSRVILIDADLRRGMIGTYLGLPPGVGLTNVLLGTVGLREAIQRFGGSLDVLTRGPNPPNPAEMLCAAQMRNLLALLREEYDAVVLDAPPVLPVADAAGTAAACDGVLMVVRHGRTRRDQLQRAAETLRAADAPLLGVVINRDPTRHREGYYYGYYAPRPGLARSGRATRRQAARHRTRGETSTATSVSPPDPGDASARQPVT